MANRHPILLPRLEKLMSELGENIKLARLRRKLSSQQVAERAGISRTTLVSIEKGYADLSRGTKIRALKEIMEKLEQEGEERRAMTMKIKRI